MTLSLAHAWKVLEAVPDPEIPVITITDLGIVRDLIQDGGAFKVVVTPTYSGCPATEFIEHSIKTALLDAGAQSVTLEIQLSPAWTTDWLNPDAREKLKRYGIAPPSCTTQVSTKKEQVIQFMPRQKDVVECPRCNSKNNERLSEFGATACKALSRCLDCREPFEYFKPIELLEK